MRSEVTVAVSCVCVCVCVCMSVCLSVDYYSHAAGYNMAYERYQWLPCYKHSKTKMATKTAAFELEKLAIMPSKLPDPTHRLVLHMCIYTHTVLCLGDTALGTSSLIVEALSSGSNPKRID